MKLAYLKSGLVLFIVLSLLVACDDAAKNENVTGDNGGDALAEEMTTPNAGELAGEIAGEMAGKMAGEMACEMAGSTVNGTLIFIVSS